MYKEKCLQLTRILLFGIFSITDDTYVQAALIVNHSPDWKPPCHGCFPHQQAPVPGSITLRNMEMKAQRYGTEQSDPGSAAWPTARGRKQAQHRSWPA